MANLHGTKETFWPPFLKIPKQRLKKEICLGLQVPKAMYFPLNMYLCT